MLTTVDLSKATSGAEGGGRVFALDGGAWLLVTPGPDGGASFDGGDGGIPAQTATLGQSLSTSPYSHRRFRFSAEVNVAVADTDTSLLTVVTADDAGAGILATLTTRAESLDVRYSTLSDTGGSTKMVLPHDAWVLVALLLENGASLTLRGEANGELTDPLTIAGTFPPNGESHFFVGPFDVFDRTELKVRNVSIETCP